MMTKMKKKGGQHDVGKTVYSEDYEFDHKRS